MGTGAIVLATRKPKKKAKRHLKPEEFDAFGVSKKYCSALDGDILARGDLEAGTLRQAQWSIYACLRESGPRTFTAAWKSPSLGPFTSKGHKTEEGAKVTAENGATELLTSV